MPGRKRAVIKSFQVDPDHWANFEKVCQYHQSTPSEMLRHFVKHTDAAIVGIRSGVVKSFDGDITQLIRCEFSNRLTPLELQLMSDILVRVVKQGRRES